MLRIRAFHAPDDVDAGEKFAIGHRLVLENLGVKVTSGSNDWINDPFVYVMVVEDTERDNEIVGGVRLHIAHRGGKLPMEKAIGKVDDKIYGEIDKLIDEGTAEICGIWNSRAVMGKGLGAIYVMRSAIALAEQIGLKTLLSFASKATRQRGYNKGFEPFVSVGNNGEFNYPKLDLIATAVICYDPNTLKLASEEERNEILYLRQNLNHRKMIKWPKGEFELEYQLQLDKKE